MKKLDKLILKSFFGPFFLTFFITVFILMLQFMLKYFDDIIGKGLETAVLLEFLLYFSIRITPDALPLAILLSSLMAFGNLGEHFELTAIKSAGISLTRAIQPIFIFSILLSIGAFFSNNYVVPAANLKALSLLYDIKQKKPSLDLKEGSFYDGIPNFSIKVKEKYPDDITLRDVIIYDHTKGVGNNRVIFADSSRMYTFMNERYLMFELFNGHLFEENSDGNDVRTINTDHINEFTRNEFKQMKMVFSLESFDLKRTKEDLFAGDYRMKKIDELQYDIDSMSAVAGRSMFNMYKSVPILYKYHMHDKISVPATYRSFELELEELMRKNADTIVTDPADSTFTPVYPGEEPVKKVEKERIQESSFFGLMTFFLQDTPTFRPKIKQYTTDTTWQGVVEFTEHRMVAAMKDERYKALALDVALNSARNIKTSLNSNAARVITTEREVNKYAVELYRKYAQAAACFSMFLIGAPLGAIIKKGGLGVPVIISIFFYILYYVLNILSIKWARESFIDPMYAAWLSNMVLFPIGLFFLRQARKDARIFDTDIYAIYYDRLVDKFKKYLGNSDNAIG